MRGAQLQAPILYETSGRQKLRLSLMQLSSSKDIAKLLGEMSLEEKLGQLTMIRADEAEVRNARAGSILDLQEPARIHKLQEIAVGNPARDPSLVRAGCAARLPDDFSYPAG